MFWSSLCCTRQCRNHEILGRCGQPLRLNCGSAAAPPACHQESLQTEEIKRRIRIYIGKLLGNFKTFTTASQQPAAADLVIRWEAWIMEGSLHQLHQQVLELSLALAKP